MNDSFFRSPATADIARKRKASGPPSAAPFRGAHGARGGRASGLSGHQGSAGAASSRGGASRGARARGGQGGRGSGRMRSGRGSEADLAAAVAVGDDENDDPEGVSGASPARLGLGKAAALAAIADDEDAAETPADKRLRLAKALIAQMRADDSAPGHSRRAGNGGGGGGGGDGGDGESGDVDSDDSGGESDAGSARRRSSTAAVAKRLHVDMLSEKGTLQRVLAATIDTAAVLAAAPAATKSQRLSVTCVAVTANALHAYTATKDGDVTKWRVADLSVVVVFEGLRSRTDAIATATAAAAASSAPATATMFGHTGHVFALALSSDDTMLASGGADKLVIVWDAVAHVALRRFTGHRGPVYALAFRRKTHQLFSGSGDRTLKVWNLAEMAFVETLYGHEDAVLGVAALDRDRAVSCGARDRSLRMWKITEESQLVFNGAHGSSDCVAMLAEGKYVSGTDQGTLLLWDSMKKKPICVVPNAHGAGHWVTSVAAVPYSDLVASGSNDGFLRLWLSENPHKVIVPLLAIPVLGFINAISFAPNAQFVAVAVGKEYRLGRWGVIKEAKNAVQIITLPSKSS